VSRDFIARRWRPKTKPAPESAGFKTCRKQNLQKESQRRQELAFNTVTARRFCDQHEMSLQTATGRSLP
jgi:hypothetical protein